MRLQNPHGHYGPIVNLATPVGTVPWWAAWQGFWRCSLFSITSAADLDDARALFDKGDYDACIEMTKAEVERGIWHDGCPSC